VISIKDADSFFTAVEDKVSSLEELPSPAPLSVAAAVASLKRYIAEPRHRIRFHDLLIDEADRASRKFKNDFPPNGSHRSDAEFLEEIRRRVTGYEAGTETLRNLFMHGSNWAEPEHYGAFLKAIQIVVPPNDRSGTTHYLQMQRYPAALLFYAGGVGAMATRNIAMLRSLLTMKIRHGATDADAVDVLSANSVLDWRLARTLPDMERHHTPASDRMLQILTPMLDTLYIDPEDLFDRFEVMVALAYLDRTQDLSRGQWMPPGRYLWKARHIGEGSPHEKLFGEAEAHGEEWGPLKAGMFGGKRTRFLHVKSAFTVSLNGLVGHYS
jgi:hypothetical protein